jgi:puromycin-sensitive aminopeptidase
VAVESYRLPPHTRPRSYELELRPNLAMATFEGHETVTVDVAEATLELVLNCVELQIRRAEIEDPDGRILEAVPDFDVDNQLLILAFPVELQPASGYRLHVDFAGTLNDKLRGFYLSTFRGDDGNERLIATTQFEASDARRAFPCWDEPSFKATFQVTLVVEPGTTALSNAELTSRKVRPDGRVEMRFAESMVMSTYLVAFVVGPFEFTQPVYAAGIPVRVAAVTGKRHLAGYALEVAAHAITFLTEYFGIPYPSEKLDHVAIPDFAFGAMENLGCATYRESLLLADPETAARAELQRIALVVAHETAHMWFGDLVTMKWWNGIWLNEAFATFMELTTTEAYRPEWQVWTGFGAGKAAAMTTDGLRATRPVEFPVGRPEEAEGMFDVLTYQKGGSVLRMLEQYIGPEAFRKGISHYLAVHSYGNTETSDLWDAIETVSGEPVRTIMDSWIGQGGYPVVSVERGGDPATVVLRQKRFVYDGGETSELWSIPVNLRASVGGAVHRERLLLDQPEGSFTFPGPVDWVVVNDGAWGFYRTRYSSGLWEALREADLSALERLEMLNDTWAAVAAGQGELREWAEVALAVTGEPDPDIWGAVGGVLALLDLISSEADLQALEPFVRRLAGSVWEQVGWESQPGEDERTAVARGRILLALAQVGRDPGVLEEANDRFSAHLAGETVLDPDVVGAAARAAVATGSRETWQQVVEAYRHSDKPQEQLRYLYALAETPVPGLRLETLELMLGDEVRSQDAPYVVAAVLSRQDQAQAWRWLESRWDAVVSRFPASLLVRMLEAVTSFVDPQLAQQVRQFCQTHDSGVAPIRLQQILERMDVTVALAARLRGTLPDSL